MSHVKFVQNQGSKHLHLIGIDCSISATAFQLQEKAAAIIIYIYNWPKGAVSIFHRFPVLSYAFLGKHFLFVGYINRTKPWRGQC